MKDSIQVLFEKRAQAPSPCKDYHQLLVTDHHVIFNTWVVSLRKDRFGKGPSQSKLPYDMFPRDHLLASIIRNVFGDEVFFYVKGLVQNDWLIRMKESILLKIFSYIDLADISRLGRVCRHLRYICNKNALWKVIYENKCSTTDILLLGETISWKNLFFKNTLQTQKDIYRMRKYYSSEQKKDKNIMYRRPVTKNGNIMYRF